MLQALPVSAADSIYTMDLMALRGKGASHASACMTCHQGRPHHLQRRIGLHWLATRPSVPVDNGARKLLKSAVRQYMPSDREWAAGGVVGGLVAIFAAAAVATLLVWQRGRSRHEVAALSVLP